MDVSAKLWHTRGMKSALFAVALSALSTPAAADALRQFDLVCVGERRSDSEDGSTSSPTTQHLRVDLDRREFCRDDCEATAAIAEINSDVIAFRNTTNTSAPGGMIWSQFFVNRKTGKYFDQRMFPHTDSTTEEGVCEAKPFTGFPPQPDNLF